MDVGGVGVPCECGDLKGGEGLDAFAAGDGEGPGLVGAGEAPCAFGDVAADALGGAERLVAELRIADLSGLDEEQELHGDVEGSEPMMWELRRSRLVGHAPHRAAAVTAHAVAGAAWMRWRGRCAIGRTDQPRPTNANDGIDKPDRT